MLHQIGVGALGPVYRTYEPSKDRLVAVKVFRLDITPEQARDLADALGRAADSALFHPSIVEPLAAGIEGTVAYRAEEYVAGESLDVAIKHYAPAPLDRALPFLTQLAGAIDFARAAGVGHGALHLRDIFVTPDEARASGFGVVEALERVGLRAPVRRPYSAPERIAGAAWDTTADVFSLAAIAYELLTGRRPSGTGDQIGALSEDSLGAGATAVWGVLARAMNDDPSERFTTALGFVAALEEADRSRPIEPPLAGPVAAATSPREPLPETTPEPASEPIVETARPPVETESPASSERRSPDRESPVPDQTTSEQEQPAPIERYAVFPEEAVPLVGDGGAVGREEGEPSDDELPLDATAPGAGAGEEDVSGEDPVDAADAPAYADEYEERRKGLSGAVMLVIGLVLGAAAGYLVWGRHGAVAVQPAGNPSTAASASATPPAQTSQPPARPGEPGRPWSDQTVAQPPAAAPTISPPAPGNAASRPAPPTTGRIVVQSVPSRAGVVVNGQWMGRTPLTLASQKFGRYVVRVTQPGFTPAEESFSLSEDAPARTLSVRLMRAAVPAEKPRAAAPSQEARGSSVLGSFFVDSRPQGATIYVDGKAMGTTPARIPEVPIGSHVVRLELADYRAWTVSTRVAAGQETRVTGSLERIR